jgi:hypothetical protein
VPLPKLKITQQLDPNIDWNTFQFGRVNLGGFGVNVPVTVGGKNTTTMSARVPGPVSWGVTIDLYATVNRATGLVTWDISALDPVTLEPIADRSRGLLPPDPANPNARVGQVYCTMATNAGVANGTHVFHSAGIAFGEDPPIFTTPVSNIIDAAPPTSDVAPLPAFSALTTFPISWNGADASGNAWYDVYVSDNGGPYVPFQATARTTSANFTGQTGHTYSFYSIATDNLGNPQGAPGAIRTTAISGAPTVATAAAITPSPVAGNSAALSVLGADDGGEANLAYAWSVVTKPTGAANPTFSANGTNAAKNSTATFSQSGSYTLRATISDGALSTTSDVSFTVDLWPAQNDNNRFDVNSDNAVDVLDLIDLIGLIVTRGQGPAPLPMPTDNPKLYPDVNGDGQMDIFDLVDMIDVLVNPPPPPAAAPSLAAPSEAPEGEANDWLAVLAHDAAISETTKVVVP